MKMIRLILFTLLFVPFAPALANEASPYAEVARLRQYAGGEDESDLKVQPVLNQASQLKKKKQTSADSNEGF